MFAVFTVLLANLLRLWCARLRALACNEPNVYSFGVHTREPSKILILLSANVYAVVADDVYRVRPGGVAVSLTQRRRQHH